MKSIGDLILALVALLPAAAAYPRPASVVRKQADSWSPWPQQQNGHGFPYSSQGGRESPSPGQNGRGFWWQGQTNKTAPAVVEYNTLNTTVPPPATGYVVYPEVVASGQLPLSIINNLPSSGTNGSANAYVTGLDANGRLVMLQSNGNFYYPSTNSSVPVPITADTTIPLGGQGSTTTVNLPGWISAGRIWISFGTLQFFVVQSEDSLWSLVEPSVVASTDPNINVNYGFVELTNDQTLGLFVNLSFVDFVGLALGIAVTTAAASTGAQASSATGTTQTVSGLTNTSGAQICSDLKAQGAIDGQPWGDLCVTDPTTGNLIRVLAPADYISSNPTAFSDYWNSYISQVWQTYSTQPLVIDTQSSAGNVSCTVSGQELSCAGDNRTFPMPSALDIFNCNTGTFSILSTDNDIHRAVVPRLCAAFNRSTLLLPGGNVQPSLSDLNYYTVSPTNYYSKFVHKYEALGIGYAFSYDDVAPDNGINQSGLLLSTNPSLLTVTIQGGTA